VFEMTDGVVRGDVDAALRALNRLLDDGDQPVALVGMLAWTTRQLIRAHDLSARGLPQREILGSLKGPWEKRKAILQVARRAGRDRLLELLAACGEVDVRVKGTRQTRRGADRHESARGFLERWCRKACEL
jgi:DNA polymerase III delta subunit